MPNNSNENSDNSEENSGDGDANHRHPPPPPTEPAETPQQQPGPQPPNPVLRAQDGHPMDELETEEALDDELEALLAAAGRSFLQDAGGQGSMLRLVDQIDLLAQYNFLVFGGPPPGLLAAVEAVAAVDAAAQDRVQLGMASEDILAIPGRTYAVPKCSICGEVFQEADLVRQLPSCRHEFHSTCLVDSLVKSSGAGCPQCGKAIQLN